MLVGIKPNNGLKLYWNLEILYDLTEVWNKCLASRVDLFGESLVLMPGGYVTIGSQLGNYSQHAIFKLGKKLFCKSLAINWTCMALNDVWVTFLYRIRDQLEEKLIFPLENWVPSWLRCHLCPWWVVGYHHWSVCVDGGWFSIQLIATNDVKTAATATRITCCWIISFRTGRG